MLLIFVHGWSVTHTKTYGDLPASLAREAAEYGLEIDIQHVYLGKYISFHDEVTLDDIARAFNNALHDLPGNRRTIKPFSCITHSTGGPVVRHWVDQYYGAASLDKLPLKHLVMLAPANHGSSLAVLGKQRVGRIKAWFDNVEPGQRVLDWLSLGSQGQWELNESFLKYKSAKNKFFPFVLTGQGIDTKFYDFLNNYLTESGSDGVVRVAGANMNYRYFSLVQTARPVGDRKNVFRLETHKTRPVRRPESVPLAVFSRFSHSGTKMGIMAVKSSSEDHRIVVDEVLKCLAVKNAEAYAQRRKECAALTATEQQKKPRGKKSAIGQYSMLVFRVHDHRGEVLHRGDYDVLMLAGAGYRPDDLPKGFLVDRQINAVTGSLVFYVNANMMAEIKDGLFGIRIIARPDKGFSYYNIAEYRSEGLPVDKAIAPNETLYIDVTLHRQVDKNVFRFARADEPYASFKKVKPAGETVDGTE